MVYHNGVRAGDASQAGLSYIHPKAW